RVLPGRDGAGGLLRQVVAGVHRAAARRRARLHLGNGPTVRTLAGGLIAALALAAWSGVAAAAPDRNVPPDEDRFLNAPLPNIALTTAAGTRTDLAGVAAGRPLLLALVF